MKDGFLHCFHWKRIPVRAHWSVPVLAIVEVLTGRSFAGLLAFGFIILVHELGHAVLVRRYRLRVREILIHPLGGECIHDATENERQSIAIAWGGVAAQFALLVAAYVLIALVGPLPFDAANEFVAVLTIPNALIAAFNLIPIRPFDGYTAWKVLRLRRAPRSSSKPSKPRKATRIDVPHRRDISVRQHRDVDALVDEALERARTAKAHEDEGE